MQGSLDTVFLLGDKYLVAEGWLASSHPRLDAVAIVGESGVEHSVRFQVFNRDRPDVLQAMPQLAGQGLAVAGFLLVVELAGCASPKTLTVRMAEISTPRQFDLVEPLSNSHGVEAKFSRLFTIPDSDFSANLIREFDLATGAIDRFMRMASGGFVAEGWYVGSTEYVAEARLCGVLGETVAASRQISLLKRPDVEDVFSSRVPSDFSCQGFRIHFSVFEGSLPTRLVLNLDQGPSIPILIPQSSPPLAHRWTPPAHAEETPSTPKSEPLTGEILAWWRLPDQSILVIGAYQGQPPESIRLESGNQSTLVSRSHFGFANRSNAHAPLFVLRAAPCAEQPTQLRLAGADGNKIALRFGASVQPLDLLIPSLVDIFGRLSRTGLDEQPAEVDKVAAFFVPLLVELRAQEILDARVQDEIRFGQFHGHIQISVIIHAERCQPSLHAIQFLSLLKGHAAECPEFLITTSAASAEQWTRYLERAHQLFGVRARLLVLSRCPTPTVARCLAATRAQGPVFCFLAPDVVANGDAPLLHLHDNLRQDLDLGVLGGSIYYPDGALYHRESRLRFAPLSNRPLALTVPGRGLSRGLLGPSLQSSAFGVGGGLLFTTAQAYQSVGGFDEAYVHNDIADFDFCLKVRRAGLKVLIDPLCAFTYFEYDSSLAGGAKRENDLALDLARLSTKLSDQDRAHLCSLSATKWDDAMRNAS